MAVVWAEARCDNEMGATPRDDVGRSLCHETSPGQFVTRVAQLTAVLKGAGWRKHKGEWVCPPCAKHLSSL